MDKLVNSIIAQVKKLFNSNCSKCGVGFNCDIEAGKGTCWCMNEKIGEGIYNPDKKCMCKTCLRKNN